MLECEDEILNTTENLLNDKKVACTKRNCLIYTISLTVIGLLVLVAICFSCCLIYKISSKTKHYRLMTPSVN